MPDESLVAILAAILSVGTKKPSEDFLPEAAYLAVAARKHVEEIKRTTSLRMDYEIAAASAEKIERILRGEA